MQLLKKNRGISLLEVLLSLSIIAIVLVTATRYFQLTSFSEKLNDSTSQIQAIRAASVRWLLSHDDFSQISIDNLINRGLVPKNFNFNSWGGPVAVEPAPDNKIKISLYQIPVKACKNLASRFSQISTLLPDCTPTHTNLADYSGIF
jgi:prepilin-type N-terminal cleavage/methylation domain-containing protein